MSIWGAVGQERAHRTFNNESLNGWSCIVKCMKMCCVFVEAFVVLNPHRTHKRWDIKFSQSIKHKTCPLCWNINRASNLKATRRKSQKFPPRTLPILSSRWQRSFVAGSKRRIQSFRVVLCERFVCRFVVFKSSSDVINDSSPAIRLFTILSQPSEMNKLFYFAFFASPRDWVNELLSWEIHFVDTVHDPYFACETFPAHIIKAEIAAGKNPSLT